MKPLHLLTLGLTASSLLLAACDDRDDATRDLEQGAEQVGEGARQVGEGLLEGAERTGVEARDAARDTGEMLDEAGNETGDFFEGMQDAAAQGRDRFVEYSRNAVDAIDRRVDAFVDDLRARGDVGEQEIDRIDDRLNAMVDDLRERLDQVRDASGDAWRDVADGFRDAYSELRRSLTDLRAQFERSPDPS